MQGIIGQLANEIPRVSADIYQAIADRAKAEGVGLSAIAAWLLADSLEAEASEPDKPAWAIALESCISQIEAQQQGNRKGRRR